MIINEEFRMFLLNNDLKYNSKENTIEPNLRIVRTPIYIFEEDLTFLPYNVNILTQVILLHDTVLPNNFKCISLSYQTRAATKLPQFLEVDYLMINGTNINTIPDTVKINKCLHAESIKELELPCTLNLESLNISNTNIIKFPKHLSITDYMTITNTNVSLEDLPEYSYIEKCIINQFEVLEIHGYYVNNSILRKTQ